MLHDTVDTSQTRTSRKVFMFTPATREVTKLYRGRFSQRLFPAKVDSHAQYNAERGKVNGNDDLGFDGPWTSVYHQR